MKYSEPRKKNVRLISILVIIVLILIGLGVYSHSKHPKPAPASENHADMTVLTSPKVISPFTLTDDSNNAFTNDNLKGHWTFLFFGFTHCGDVCPTTLSQLNSVVQQLQKDLPPENIPQVVMVTVDPERDTVPVLHDYVKEFNSNFTGVRANAEMLNQFRQDLSMYYEKVSHSNNPNDYSMSHSAELYLFNPDGNWVAMFTYPHDIEKLTQNYEALVNANAKT